MSAVVLHNAQRYGLSGAWSPAELQCFTTAACWLPCLAPCRFDVPSPDSGLEYWYALYRADIDQQVRQGCERLLQPSSCTQLGCGALQTGSCRAAAVGTEGIHWP